MYYCYVSENKVNQIIDSIKNGIINEKTNSVELDYQINNNIEIGLWSIIKTSLKFGRSKKINRSETKRNTILAKLNECLKLLKDNVRIIPEYKYLTLNELKKISIVYYSGQLKVNNYDGNYAFLESVGDVQVKLNLTCSLKYFADLYDDDTSNFVHSGNIDFFEGRIFPHFETIIYLLDVNGKKSIGTPVFLAMSLDNKLEI